MLINTSRGGLINAKDLIWGLKTWKVGSVGLDVYEEEADYFFEDFSNDVISFPSVLITSHQAFLTTETLKNIANTTITNITIFFNDNSEYYEVCHNCK